MEFVGRAVKKEFEGFGVFSGTVRSYDASSGFFEILYEDGDFEELEFSELASLFEGGEEAATAAGQLAHEKPLLGRKPKKRLRMELKHEVRNESGNLDTVYLNNGLEGNLNETLGTSGNLHGNGNSNDGFEGILEMGRSFGGNLRESVEVNRNSIVNVEETQENESRFGQDLEASVSVCGKADKNDNLNDGFDLNSGFNLNEEDLNDGCDAHVKSQENLRKRDCIDLNLDVNGDFDENLTQSSLGCSALGTQKRKRDFDLNLDIYEEIKDTDGDGDGVVGFRASNTSKLVEETPKKEGTADVEEKFDVDGSVNGDYLDKLNLDINNGNLSQDIGGSLEPAARDASLVFAEGVKQEISVYSGYLEVHRSLSGLGDSGIKDCSSMEVQLEDGLSEAGATVCHQGPPCIKGSSRRKRRRLSDNLRSTTDPVLRRSTRRGSSQNPVACTVHDPLLSPAISAVTEEITAISSFEASEKSSVLPPKPQLPPSSQNLNLDDIPIIDFFSVYACLRSFSTLLFLSPFELEDFVEALKCDSPSTLFDCIHVSILQTLRKHLEYLSNEGSESASNCLRSLDWDLLDLITWPIFMAEYLLIHGSELKPGFDISRVKLFRCDYYKQPVSLKVEVLRCLSDDMIEVEAIRSELNRRSLAAEPDMVFDRSMNLDVCKKRKVTIDVSGGSCLTEDIVEDTTDWNSDDCCLCKMDGSLICCDGCPAAYHSRCVGIQSDILPEGDWYCPECAIERHKPWMKPRKSLRGAELIGIDPHGRLYFSSCGYLLVSESCDTESTFSYYHRNDLNVVIEVLKASDVFYSDILMAIYKHWEIPLNLNEASNFDSLNHSVCSNILTKKQNLAFLMPSAPLTSSETNTVNNKTDDVRKVDETSINGCSGHLGSELSKPVSFVGSVIATESPYITSEGSAGATQSNADIPNFQNFGPHDSNRSAEFLALSQVPIKRPLLGDSSLTSASMDVRLENAMESADPRHYTFSIITRKGDPSQANCGIGYMNYYSFAQTASLVAEDLMHKSSEKVNENSILSEDDIISAQMKAILKKYNKFCWPNMQRLSVDARKEKCGWCFSCKNPTDERDCLFKMYLGPVQEGVKNDVFGLQSKKNRRGHLVDVMCHILSIEGRLQGLLLGPWLNQHHIKYWHKSILKASDLVSTKNLLLTLESNLRPLALSTEWSRQVDSAVTMGSASHVVISSMRASSKQGISRKRVRPSEPESHPSSNAASGLGIFWWRGGRLSRQVFNWKVLPCSLASKAARQAGCTKIPGILYPENSEYAKRSRFVAWRAAVETASSVEQLAYQVRELDLNIKWDDIENTHPLLALDKESRKSIRLFKKVIVRRKCTEGEVVKYLLDFGKRRAIPDIVKRHGSVVEESSSEKKKYWLAECFIPLHLLKNFEEKRIARKSNEMKSAKLLEISRVKKISPQKRGFSYLFSKAQRSEYYQCRHCNKDVPIREAVSCQYCKEYFHKRHARKSAGAITAECTFTCHRCQDGMRAKIDAKRGKTGTGGKLMSQKNKKASKDRRSVRLKCSKKASTVGHKHSQNSKKTPAVVPLRRSPRKAKCLSLPNKKRGRRKVKQIKSKKTAYKKPKRVTSWQKKRTDVYHSYWLNGLLLSRKPNDERVMRFREKNILASSERLSVILDQPKCRLCCEPVCASTLNYIGCEICGEWFHGDAFGLDPENIDKLIGFRCHVCRKRDPPFCPGVQAVKSDVSLLVEAQSNAVVDCNEEVSNAVPPLSEIACN
ncbi:DDT domain-containing protein PTM-like [Juglans microcarpa x Juglans regia]|uniref:DDT domain-containing protein PTM-like n=1 Tax=Juglans microcarpa x Juglans regia TaxID=2249226 RepID=UPI001B7EBFB0|nr:DDT domain-containing protein PTM-like [Juglans microcarpa x Juglans regia]